MSETKTDTLVEHCQVCTLYLLIKSRLRNYFHMEKRSSKELAGYINSQLNKGVPKERIVQVLTGKGYPAGEIEKTFWMALELNLRREKPKDRKKYFLVTAAVLVIFISIISIGAHLTVSRFKEQERAREHEVSVGNISGFIAPDAGNENITVAGRRLLSLKCTSDGRIACNDAVADTYFVRNNNTNISRFEQWIYMTLKNKEDEPANVTAQMEGAAQVCGPLEDSIFIGAQESAQASFACIHPFSPGTVSGVISIKYMAAGVEKQSVIRVENT